MAFPRPHHLSSEQIRSVLATLPSHESVTVVRIRYRNMEEIRASKQMSVDELTEFILNGMEEEHLPGGDLEVHIKALGKILVGHHDGVFCLEEA